MTDKEFDDLFTSAFARHEVPVPDGMWQRVQPPRRRRGAVVWLPMLGAAVAVVLCATVWLYRSPVSSHQNKTVVSALQKKRTEKQQATESANHIALQKQNRTFEDRKAEALINSKKLSLKNKDNLSRSASNDEKIKDNKPVLSSFTKSGKIAIDESKFLNQKDSLAQAATTQPWNERPSNETGKAISEIPQIKTSDSSSAITLKNKNINLKPILNSNEKASVEINKKDTKDKSEWELMIAGYLSDRHVYDVAKSGAMPLFTLSAVNPKTKISLGSFSVNARFSEPLGRNLFFKTGLQFLQTRQSIIYTQQSVARYAFVSTISNAADTMRYSQVSLQRPLVKSVYNSINIPLLIAYETSASKLQIGATAGAVVNFFSWYHGEVPDGDYSKTVEASNTFKWNHGIALYAGVQVSKDFGDWRLFAEPHLQYALSSLTNNSASFKQKINNYGIGIGIRRKIGKRSERH